jgi:Flp pilus assembly protein TadG
MVMATIEFGIAFNGVLDVNYASRNAALLAAEAGNSAGADCVILESIETDIDTPSSTGISIASRLYFFRTSFSSMSMPMLP